MRPSSSQVCHRAALPRWPPRSCLTGPLAAACAPAGCRFDGIWHNDRPTCGSYSEIEPAAPGAPGSLPNVELAEPELVLQQAVEELGAAAAAAAQQQQGQQAAVTALGMEQQPAEQHGQQRSAHSTMQLAATHSQHSSIAATGQAPSHARSTLVHMPVH